MKGAESLVRTLVKSGINVCFANPGTSEMHFVAALDRIEEMRGVLCLFEGVATGAADGYSRMIDRPACTLLHLGPGLGNALSNLHNAKRANSSVINIVGDHATYHRDLDTPLTTDIETTARPFSHWVRTCRNANNIAGDTHDAICASMAPPGAIATLIVAADASWNEVENNTEPVRPSVSLVREFSMPDKESVAKAAKMLRGGEATALYLSGQSLRERGLYLAGQIAERTGARLIADNGAARIARGAGRVPIERLPLGPDQALGILKNIRNLILVGVGRPISVFAYPNKPSELTAPGTNIISLATPEENAEVALEWLGAEVNSSSIRPRLSELHQGDMPTGNITREKLGALLGALIPEDCIVVDESITTGRGFFAPTHNARQHDWLLQTGGSIGYALPCATGAAIACPDRKVLCLESDGSGMYMPQALWTQAREGLDVTTILFSNRRYAILSDQMASVGASNPGKNASGLLELDRPTIDWVSLAKSMGVPSARAETIDDLGKLVAHELQSSGPSLIDVVL